MNMVSKIPHLICNIDGFDIFERTDIPDNHIHCDLNVLREGLELAGIQDVPFARYPVVFDHAVSTDRCVETTNADRIVMWQRPTRAGATRMVLGRNADPTNEMLIVICQDTDNNNRLTIVTAYTGKPGTKEPWDPNFRNEEERAAAIAFWANHALIPTAEELAQMVTDGVITEAEAKQEMERKA